MIRDYLLFGLFGFFMGSVLYSYWLPKLLMGIDITALSKDKNPGAFNAFQFANSKIGSICLILDILKGFLPIFLAGQHLDVTRMWFALVIASPVIGHAFSPWAHCKGGKAIAVTFGVLLGMYRYSMSFLFLALLFLFLTFILQIQPHSQRVIVSMLLFALLCILLPTIPSVSVGGCIAAAVVIFKHLYRQAKEPIYIRLLPYSKLMELVKRQHR